MQQPELWTDRILSDRSTSLFQALHIRELRYEDYAELVEQVLDPDVAFFLKNSYSSLAHSDGGN